MQGVRDEVGFLLLHQAYSNRFFPGTSVLQSRLRYILFVPWMYRDLTGAGARMEEALRNGERDLAGRLKKSEKEGVIGGRTYPDPTSQPPSMIYWTALGAWGILRQLPDGSLPSRRLIHTILSGSRSRSALKDEDNAPLQIEHDAFVGLPEPPKEWWDTSKPLFFRLRSNEQKFIKTHLQSANKPSETDQPSLLSRLSGWVFKSQGIIPEYPWDDVVLNIADDEDRSALLRARSAAALSAIGRGVYAALVEDMKIHQDNKKVEPVHYNWLMEAVDLHKAEALKLNLDELIQDIPNLPPYLRSVLKETQSWLHSKQSIKDLHAAYAIAESKRKGQRARLVKSVVGPDRRAEWRPSDGTQATPLHYRWPNVEQLLRDLGGIS